MFSTSMNNPVNPVRIVNTVLSAPALNEALHGLISLGAFRVIKGYANIPAAGLALATPLIVTDLAGNNIVLSPQDHIMSVVVKGNSVVGAAGALVDLKVCKDDETTFGTTGLLGAPVAFAAINANSVAPTGAQLATALGQVPASTDSGASAAGSFPLLAIETSVAALVSGSFNVSIVLVA